MKKTYWNIQGKEIDFHLNWFENLIMKSILKKHNYNISSKIKGQRPVIIHKVDRNSKKHIKVTEWLCDCIQGKKKFKQVEGGPSKEQKKIEKEMRENERL